MRKKMEWNWEELDATTWRAAVIGGWLIHTKASCKGHISASLVFIADSEHAWTIVKMQEEKPDKPSISEGY